MATSLLSPMSVNDIKCTYQYPVFSIHKPIFLYINHRHACHAYRLLRNLAGQIVVFSPFFFFCCAQLHYAHLLIRLKGNLFQGTDKFFLPHRLKQVQFMTSKEIEVISNLYSATTNLSQRRILENHPV